MCDWQFWHSRGIDMKSLNKGTTELKTETKDLLSVIDDLAKVVIKDYKQMLLVCFILFTQTWRYVTEIFPAQLQLGLPGEI